MKVKSLVKMALSIAFAMVLILVVVPSGMASADLMNDVQPNLVKSEFNTEQTEIVSKSSDGGEETSVINETFTNSNESKGCLALAEGQNVNPTQLDMPKCEYKSDCTLCNPNVDPSLCQYYRAGQRCIPC